MKSIGELVKMIFKPGDKVIWHTSISSREQGQPWPTLYPVSKRGTVVGQSEDRSKVLIELGDKQRHWAKKEDVEKDK